MSKEPVYLTAWEHVKETRTKLYYSDGRELEVDRADFNRTFITFVSSPPEDIERDFCNKGVENK